MLQSSGIQYGKNLNAGANISRSQETFDDFDNIISEVSAAPYGEFCKELKEFDF